jgi:hypothetical protein
VATDDIMEDDSTGVWLRRFAWAGKGPKPHPTIEKEGVWFPEFTFGDDEQDPPIAVDNWPKR